MDCSLHAGCERINTNRIGMLKEITNLETYIPCEPVERSVVATSLVFTGKNVVLCNVVSSDGMDRTRKVVRKQKVKHRAPANKVYHSRGEDYLDDSVGHKPTVQWQRVHHHGAESVGPDLVELPEPFTRSGGAEPDLKVRGKILIKLGSLVLVCIYM